MKYYSSVDPALYDKILNMCVDPSQTCIKDMMAADGMSGGMNMAHDIVMPHEAKPSAGQGRRRAAAPPAPIRT